MSASIPSFLPIQLPAQVPTQQPSPVQSPVQSVVQAPIRQQTFHFGHHPVAQAVKQLGDVTLDESKAAITMHSGNGDSLKIWGDPHVVATIDGTTTKFDIGAGPGSVQLQDGTNVSWDTSGWENTLRNFTVTGPDGTQLMSVDASDTNYETGVKTGLTDDQLREFAGKLEDLQGSVYHKLGDQRKGFDGLTSAGWTLHKGAPSSGAPGKSFSWGGWTLEH